MSESAPSIGHNVAPFAPLVTIDEIKLRAGLTERYASLIAKVDEYKASRERFRAIEARGIADDDTAGKVGDIVKQLGGWQTAVDEKRVAEKAHILSGGRAIDAWFKDLGASLADYRRDALAALDAFNIAKEVAARKAMREQAERDAAEAERLAKLAEASRSKSVEAQAVETEQRSVDLAAAAAQTKAADLTRVRGDNSSTQSLTTTYSWEVEDISKVPAHMLMVNKAMADAALKSAPRVNGMPQFNVPGLRLVATKSTRVR